MIPAQLDPQHYVPVALSCALSFFLCFLIVTYFLTPKITRAINERVKLLDQQRGAIELAQAHIESKRAELRQLHLTVTYSTFHKKWEVEYRRLLQFNNSERLYRERQKLLQLHMQAIIDDPGLRAVGEELYARLRGVR